MTPIWLALCGSRAAVAVLRRHIERRLARDGFRPAVVLETRGPLRAQVLHGPAYVKRLVRRMTGGAPDCARLPVGKED